MNYCDVLLSSDNIGMRLFCWRLVKDCDCLDILDEFVRDLMNIDHVFGFCGRIGGVRVRGKRFELLQQFRGVGLEHVDGVLLCIDAG